MGWTKESFKNDIQLQWMIKQLNWKPNDQKINWKLFAKKNNKLTNWKTILECVRSLIIIII